MARFRTRAGRQGDPPQTGPTSETRVLDASLDSGVRRLAPLASLLVTVRLALALPGIAADWPWLAPILSRVLDILIGLLIAGETYTYWRTWRCRRLQTLLLETRLRAELRYRKLR